MNTVVTLRPSQSNTSICVLIRALKHSSALTEPKWRVLKRVSTRQEAIKVVNEHQRDPLNSRRFQYRII